VPERRFPGERRYVCKGETCLVVPGGIQSNDQEGRATRLKENQKKNFADGVQTNFEPENEQRVRKAKRE
jgi:hypothetical protein